jgi:hypothetical protein
MKDEIAKLNEMVKKVIAYGPSRKNAEKDKARAKRIKARKRTKPVA